MGHSAGCHLVTLLALDPRYLAGVGLHPSDLRGVVAWSGGAYDLVAKVKAGGTYGPYIKQAFGDSEAAWRDASPDCPRRRCQAHAALPVRLCSNMATIESGRRKAGRFDQRKARQGGAAGLEGRTHMTANQLIGAPDDTTGALLLTFVREVTR